MSIYTTKYLDILRNYALPERNQSFDELIETTYNKFFNFDFPWYAKDGTGKDDFKKLFLGHYMMHEIGQESLELHRMYLANRLRLLMPEFEIIYESLTLDMPWDSNIDITYTTKADNSRQLDGNNKGTNTTTTKSETQSIDSDNPQVNFSGTDYASAMNRGQADQTSTNESSGTTTNTENQKVDETRTETGVRGLSRGEIAKQIRESVYNINMELIKRCSDLFMLMY